MSLVIKDRRQDSRQKSNTMLEPDSRQELDGSLSKPPEPNSSQKPNNSLGSNCRLEPK